MTGAAEFARRYGPWAVVAGASEGLGAAFARGLGRRGLHLLLIARRAEKLEAVADEIRAELGVEVQTLAIDLSQADLSDRLRAATALLKVGLVVYNAAYAPVGDFIDRTPEELGRVVDVNVRGPLLVTRGLVGPMVARGRGAVVLMSSLAGLQGTPRVATYAASKAFNIILAEGLWHELRGRGVDVIASCAGAIRTPGYAGAAGKDAPGTLDPEVVVERTLAAVGRGPRVVPGLINKIASLLVGRWLPRRLSIAVMASSTRDLT
jgi:short-subunit dehydrogenase